MTTERARKIWRRKRFATKRSRRRALSQRVAGASSVFARVHIGLPIVRALAARMSTLHVVEESEAIALGNLGLLQAARTFRAGAGLTFISWAVIRIRGAILDGLRQANGVPRLLCRRAGSAEVIAERKRRYVAGMVTASEEGFIAVSVVARDEITPSPERALLDSERWAALRRAVQRLPSRERAIIEGHYFSDETLTAASHGVGASKSWGSRLHAQALRRLRRELARNDEDILPGPRVRRFPIAASAGRAIERESSTNEGETPTRASWRTAC